MAKNGMYKQIKTFTKDMGSAGSQILLGYVEPLDDDLDFGYLNNIRLTAILQTGDGDAGGILCFLNASSSWSDSHIITADACPGFGGKMNLSAKRKVSGAQQITRPDGRVYLYAELTDITVTTDVQLRCVIECYGKFIKFVEA